MLLKKLTLIFTGISVILCLYTITVSNFSYKKLADFDIALHEENPEKENDSCENIELFNPDKIEFQTIKFQTVFRIAKDQSLQKNTPDILTSPPNA